jgi:hypothetical protein
MRPPHLFTSSPLHLFTCLVLQKPLAGAADVFLEGDAMPPAEGMQAGNVEELSRRAVGLGGVEHELAYQDDTGGKRT